MRRPDFVPSAGVYMLVDELVLPPHLRGKDLSGCRCSCLYDGSARIARGVGARMNADVLARHRAAMRAIRKVDDRSDRRLLLLYVLFGSEALRLAETELDEPERVDQLEAAA